MLCALWGHCIAWKAERWSLLWAIFFSRYNFLFSFLNNHVLCSNLLLVIHFTLVLSAP